MVTIESLRAPADLVAAWTTLAIGPEDLRVTVPRFQATGRFRHRLATGARLPAVDPVKHWDAANVAVLLQRIQRPAAALDCGAYNSPVPLMLAELGVASVHGVDLNPHLPSMPTLPGVHWSCQNIVATSFSDNSFDLVTCCSTIEHGVDWDAFLAETARVLRPGGWLYVSTDLVPDDAPENHGTAFGLPWWPLRPKDLHEHAAKLTRHGFAPPPIETIELPAQLPIEFLGQHLGFVAFSTQFQGEG